jgi:hypothetical protein
MDGKVAREAKLGELKEIRSASRTNLLLVRFVLRFFLLIRDFTFGLRPFCRFLIDSVAPIEGVQVVRARGRVE